MPSAAKPLQKHMLEILEESLHLLRRMGVESLCVYAIGALPFVLGLMYFWADMSQSPFADAHLLPASLGLAVLFVWMKCWQALFMRGMLAKACGDQPPRCNVHQIGRMIITQTIIQPLGLIVLPLSALLVLPLPFALAIFNTATVLGDGQENLTTRQVIRQSWRMGMLWPGQSMSAILLIMPAILTIVLLNVVQAIIIPPYMMKLLLGIETFFTQINFSFLNTTFLLITLGVTYLCVDPLVKAFYTLRCFHGRSIQTGQDLHAELKSITARRTAQALGAAALLAALLLPASPLGAQTPPPARPAAPNAVNPDQLDNSIRKVINRRQYAWRMPRDKSQMRGFLDSLSEKIKAWQEENRRKQREAEKNRKDETPPKNSSDHSSAGGSVDAGSLQAIIYVLIVLAAGALIGLLVFAWRHRQPKEEKPQEEETETASPDLTDEDITADHLPEEGWLELARQMLAQGDRRLALRALYLASLALLSERQIISIAKFKSNREYEAEVRRRGHSLPEVTTAFGQNVTFFEDAWYGMHDVTENIVNNFAFNQERIRSLASR